MRIRTFVAVVLLGAAAICGALLLARSLGDRPPVDLVGLGSGDAPEHVFVPRPDSDGRIACAITAADDWPASWNGMPRLCSLGRGWTQAQAWGVWAMGLTSVVTVHLDAVSPRALVIKARSNPDLPAESRQAVRLTVNGHAVDRRPVPQHWELLRFELPAEVLRVGSNELAFQFETAISPLEAGRSSDSRALAVAVSELALLAATEGARHDRSSKLPTRIWDPDRRVFTLQGEGSLVLPLRVPDTTAAIRFELGASRSAAGSGSSVVATLEDLEGAGHSRRAIRLPQWQETVQVDLEAAELAGRRALLTVEFDLPSGLVVLSPPALITGDGAAPPDPAAAPGAQRRNDRDRRPDIVLITLDAARAGNFSFAGYGRETTPHIDAVAAESLLFPNAYALAPYTMCSVPTMITGLSFLDHGVVDHEDVLSPDAVTLAESLKELGYRTACFSATPNNSRAKGFDQGYDVFREMWNEGPRNLTRRAFFIAKQVVGWLRDEPTDDDRPLHLQVHMVPPHAPYDPPEAFDLFTDPDYSGPCQGYARTLNALDGGAIPATPECLEHVLALYDGNLRTADNATNAILNTLRRRPRWRDTVVLITSDHGEAFFERGRMEHNSTVFAEMMHVPFVLRLPPDWDASAVDTDGLVTLADIVPTLIAAAGGSPPVLDEGVNLLDGAVDRGGRHLVARTAEARPTIGLRTLRWSMMVNPGGTGALFDLGADPGEHDNLIARKAPRYAGLAAILAGRLAEPPRLRAVSPSADISEEERALLETLGYVR